MIDDKDSAKDLREQITVKTIYKSADIEDDKNLHAGHRQRVYAAVDKDPSLETFSEVETLEYLLFIAYTRENTNPLAHKLLNKFGSLSGVFQASVDELIKVKGISKRIAYFLRSVPAVARKAQLTRVKPQSIKDISSALEFLKRHFDNRFTESMYIMCLDATDKVLGVDCVTALGTATSNVISVPAIMESALHHHASKVIIAHNHPAGVMNPSDKDLETTDLVIDSLAALDVVIIDHMVFGPEGTYLSFFNSGLISVMYQNFDASHGTTLSRFLLNEKKHDVNSGVEYVFDLETACVVKRSEYEDYMERRRAQAETRGSLCKMINDRYRKDYNQ